MIIDPRRADTGMPQPFLDFGDIRPGIERIGGGGGAGGVGPEPQCGDTDLAAVDLDELIDTV